MDWTPCRLSLPKSEGYYLTTYINDDGKREAGLMKFEPGAGWVYHLEEVVAWCELSPYSGPV